MKTQRWTVHIQSTIGVEKNKSLSVEWTAPSDFEGQIVSAHFSAVAAKAYLVKSLQIGRYEFLTSTVGGEIFSPTIDPYTAGPVFELCLQGPSVQVPRLNNLFQTAPKVRGREEVRFGLQAQADRRMFDALLVIDGGFVVDELGPFAHRALDAISKSSTGMSRPQLISMTQLDAITVNDAVRELQRREFVLEGALIITPAGRTYLDRDPFDPTMIYQPTRDGFKRLGLRSDFEVQEPSRVRSRTAAWPSSWPSPDVFGADTLTGDVTGPPKLEPAPPKVKPRFEAVWDEIEDLAEPKKK